MTTPNATKTPAARRRLAIAGLVTALAAVPAVAAAGGGWGHGPGGYGMGGMGGMGMGGMPGMGPMSPQRLERMLDGIQATPAQREQLRGIFDAARTDLQAQRQAGRQLADEAAKLFREPTVDAAAVEALRQRMLAQHDRATQRMSQAMIEASRVLDADQRRQLADRMAERMPSMDRRHAGHGWR
ncbi:MAG: periplasmic heavy metal sensor [Rubrivivax sp.]|nr:periplasmic heavy metal sensor [Rubrivivax sp.]